VSVLDDPVGESVRGQHAHLARGRRRVVAYRPDVATFGAVPADPVFGDWSDLAERTRPGPFWAGTLAMGRYVGVRVDGELMAMAGERLRPPGWTEISAVRTAPQARGRGHGYRLPTA
jgi:hypothetical protein